jgi:hypothetical protein
MVNVRMWSPWQGSDQELCWGVSEPQDTLQTGHGSRDRRQGETLEQGGEEQEQFHTSQMLPRTRTLTWRDTHTFHLRRHTRLPEGERYVTDWV